MELNGELVIIPLPGMVYLPLIAKPELNTEHLFTTGERVYAMPLGYSGDLQLSPPVLTSDNGPQEILAHAGRFMVDASMQLIFMWYKHYGYPYFQVVRQLTGGIDEDGRSKPAPETWSKLP